MIYLKHLGYNHIIWNILSTKYYILLLFRILIMPLPNQITEYDKLYFTKYYLKGNILQGG